MRGGRKVGRDYCTRDLSKWHVMSGFRLRGDNTAIKFRFTPELPKMRTRRVIEPRHVRDCSYDLVVVVP